MAVSPVHIQFQYTDNASATQTFEIPTPVFGYETTIFLPFEWQRADNGTWSGYDAGAGVTTYDIRKCKAIFILDVTDHTALMAALKGDTTGRARAMILTLYAGSGVFLFGADRGDTGPFTCAVEIISEGGIGYAPYKYFHTELLITNTGSWPAYNYTPSDEGHISIGSCTGLRFPEEWFIPEIKTATSVIITESGAATYTNAGSGGDGYVTNATFKCSAQKAADLLHNLTAHIRVAAFNLITLNNAYPFGITKSTGGTYSCKLIMDQITITHRAYNQFIIPLKMAYISGP